ncbi:hypothetical protein BGZ49_004216 [Haplosporangium sp. Z 27]|nr:hypothetical protein BGZ49_004216 [Haplosporangium sp. Z 27]
MAETQEDFNFKECYPDIYKAVKSIRGVNYFLDNHPSRYSPRNYVRSVGAFALSNPTAVAKDYNKVIAALGRSSKHSELYDFAISAKRMNKAMVIHFTSTPLIDEAYIEVGQYSNDVNEEEEEEAEDVVETDISSTSLSRVASELNSSIGLMRDEYVGAFEKYSGPSFLLPSELSFEETIYRHVMELKHQSLLHSSILDSSYRDQLLKLFPDERDTKLISDHLNELAVIVKPSYQIPKWQMDVIGYYSSVRVIKETLFQGLDSAFTAEGVSDDVYRSFAEMIYDCIKGILNFYEDYGQQYQLPNQLSEKTYMFVWNIILRILYRGNFNYTTGEVTSKPSALRKNNNRMKKLAESASQQSGSSDQSGACNRQSIGRRCDGVATTKANNIEILLVECGPKDSGPNGTKTLADGFKIAKGLKDSYDYIMNEVTLNGGDITEAQREIEVYGIVVSGNRIQFVTTRHFGGRFLYFDKGHTESLPLTLDDNTLPRIRRIVAYFVQQRENMADCDRVIVRLINTDSLIQQNKYEAFPTITTPPPSPKTKRAKLQ